MQIEGKERPRATGTTVPLLQAFFSPLSPTFDDPIAGSRVLKSAGRLRTFFFCLRTRLRRQRSVIASVPAMALAMALGRAATREFCWCFRYRRLPDGQPTADILAVLVCRAVASVRPPQDAHRPPLHRRGSAASDWPAARPCQPQQRRSIGVERGKHPCTAGGRECGVCSVWVSKRGRR